MSNRQSHVRGDRYSWDEAEGYLPIGCGVEKRRGLGGKRRWPKTVTRPSTAPKGGKCGDKVRYECFCKAIGPADQYNESMALVRSPLVAFWCAKDWVFHKGHNRQMEPWRSTKYLGSSRTRARAWNGSKLNHRRLASSIS